MPTPEQLIAPSERSHALQSRLNGFKASRDQANLWQERFHNQRELLAEFINSFPDQLYDVVGFPSTAAVSVAKSITHVSVRRLIDNDGNRRPVRYTSVYAKAYTEVLQVSEGWDNGYIILPMKSLVSIEPYYPDVDV